MSQGRILVAHSDKTMQRLLSSQLSAHGYDVLLVSNGNDALTAAVDETPHLMLLGIQLPGTDGLDVCRQLREWSDLPVIIVSADNQPQTKIQALDLGADDYVTTPLHVGELLARIRAVMRRAARGTSEPAPVMELGDLTVDLQRRQVRLGEDELRLTRTEFDLLREFVMHADKVLTYDHLLDSIWGHGYYELHPVHVHISNLRRKLERRTSGACQIHAVPGIGYRFGTPDENLEQKQSERRPSESESIEPAS